MRPKALSLIIKDRQLVRRIGPKSGAVGLTNDTETSFSFRVPGVGAEREREAGDPALCCPYHSSVCLHNPRQVTELCWCQMSSLPCNE